MISFWTNIVVSVVFGLALGFAQVMWYEPGFWVLVLAWMLTRVHDLLQ